MSARDVDPVSQAWPGVGDHAVFLDAAARGWLLDCGCPEEHLFGPSAESALSVRHEVDKHYDGGWQAFVADFGTLGS